MVDFRLFKKDNKSSKKKLEEKDWPTHVITLDDSIFNDFILKYPLSVIDFGSVGCVHCRAMEPRMRRLAQLYRGKVAFGKIDIHKNPLVAKKFNIMSVPQFLFFNYGKKISQKIGKKSVGTIKETLDDLIKKYE
jgi:thioredoxin 1